MKEPRCEMLSAYRAFAGEREGLVFALVLLCAVSTLLAGCQVAGHNCKKGLFFSPDGTEHEFPSSALYRELASLPKEKRSRKIARLVSILERPGGYSRLIIGDALLSFFEHHPDDLTQRAARAIADHVVQLGEKPDMELIRDDMVEAEGGVHFTVIFPRCTMVVDAKRVELRPGLPPGWEAIVKLVRFDGEFVTDEAVLDDTDKIYPSSTVGLPFDLPDEKKDWYGVHKVEAFLGVNTPAGIVEVADSFEFEIVTVREFKRRLH